MQVIPQNNIQVKSYREIKRLVNTCELDKNSKECQELSKKLNINLEQ